MKLSTAAAAAAVDPAAAAAARRLLVDVCWLSPEPGALVTETAVGAAADAPPAAAAAIGGQVTADCPAEARLAAVDPAAAAVGLH